MTESKRFLSLLLLSASAFPASAQADLAGIVDPQVPKICAEANTIPFPAQDRPGTQEAQALANCSPEDLYFGFEQPANPEKARKCAYLKMEQRAAHTAADAKAFSPEVPAGGAGDPGYILMMVYANGKGAERNFDVAIKLACNVGWAPAEFAGRVDHLAKLKQQRWAGDDFSVCDDITSGYMAGWCALLHEKVQSQVRQKKLETIIGPWNENDRKAFHGLQRAAENFFKARAANEVDLSGTLRAALQVDEEAALREGLLSSIELFEAGHLPRFTADQARKADMELNSVYVRLQTTPWDNGTVTASGVRKVERAWIQYRDAWVTFGGQKYPKVSADSWKAWMTQARIRMLKEFLH